MESGEPLQLRVSLNRHVSKKNFSEKPDTITIGVML